MTISPAASCSSPAIIARLNRELSQLLSTTETKERSLAVDIEAAASTPGRFRDRIARDTPCWAEVVEKTKISVE